MSDERPIFDFNGQNLCPAVIEELKKLRNLNYLRMDLAASTGNANTLRGSEILRQQIIVNTLISIGESSYSAVGLHLCLQFGYLDGSLYAIGD